MVKMRNSSRVFLWASFAIGVVLSVITQVHSEAASISVPVTVTRRLSLDTYTILQGNGTGRLVCNVDNPTYLVKENRCINNEHLFNGNQKCMILVDPQ